MPNTHFKDDSYLIREGKRYLAPGLFVICMINIRKKVVILFICLLVLPSAAHVPTIPEGGIVAVPDPLKSYAWYGSLDEDAADYYTLEMNAGEELRLSISSPDEGVRPYLAVIGPGIAAIDTVPEYIRVPAGSGVAVIAPSRDPGLSYEPFTPMSTYQLSRFSQVMPSAGNYSVVVYGDGGRYILATGYLEEFSAEEWILVPVQVMAVRAWQGQSPYLVIAPIVLALIGGLAWLYRRERDVAPGRIRYPVWTGSIAGFLYIGTGLLMLIQMALALSLSGLEGTAIGTLILAVLPLALGAAAVRVASGMGEKITIQARIWMLAIGGLGFFVWAGLLAGPFLAAMTAILPESRGI